jgi:hypothetical protein
MFDWPNTLIEAVFQPNTSETFELTGTKISSVDLFD